MNTPCVRQWLLGLIASLAVLTVAGCKGAEDKKTDKQPIPIVSALKNVQVGKDGGDTAGQKKTEIRPTQMWRPAEKTQVGSDGGAIEDQKIDKPSHKDLVEASASAKRAQIGKNVELETDGDQRRVIVNAFVCLREGMLEQLMCRAGTKEHESILTADVDAKNIHAALLAAGAEAGSPVKFRPVYKPASGSVIKVFIQYREKGKLIKVPAQTWVRNFKTRKDLTHDWVFGGSFFASNGFDAKPVYAANDGDVICLANFESAMLDLPILSSANADDLDFEAFSERIPALETPVVVILEPVLPPKKQ